MNRHDDMNRWENACFDTPFQPNAARLRTKASAEKMPGVWVKSRERGEDHFPKFYGILVAYGEAEVIVRSIGDEISPPGTVWTGAPSEYHRMWEVD